MRDAVRGASGLFRPSGALLFSSRLSQRPAPWAESFRPSRRESSVLLPNAFAYIIRPVPQSERTGGTTTRGANGARGACAGRGARGAMAATGGME
jgi:hypothetical protein